MRVPLEWLKEFINLKKSPSDIAHDLTMIGLEVESMEEIEGDIIFDINVTPNRPDCLSIIGIARELSALYKIPIIFPEHNIVAETKELGFNVNIIDKDLCHRYAGRVIKNVKISESPDWMKDRLHKCNIRSINNVVDITNYVLLELGHPLHAFDLRKIKGSTVKIGTSEKIEGPGSKVKIKTLDGVEREMPDDALLIWDIERPIAIAGIMGGADTEVTSLTTDLFIESAYFEPISIRRTSKKLGLKTESSYRFERGTDIKMLKKSLDRAAYLIKVLADGDIYGKLDIYPKRFTPEEIIVRISRINEILGLNINKKDILNSLEGLGLEIEDLIDRLKVIPPTYRRDLQNEYDIIEEVARIYGYNNITSELPKATIGIKIPEDKIKNKERRVINNIRQSFLKTGFTEVINYSFMGIQDLELLKIPDKDERRNLLRILNPLRTEESFMRTMLLPSLIKNMKYNIFHGNKELRLFEISKVFIRKNEKSQFSLPMEMEHLAALYYREKTKALYRDDTPDFYILKGVVEAILNDLKIYDYYFVRTSEPFLHPGQSADIYIAQDIRVGYIGALSPEIVDSLDIKAHKPSLLVIEIDLDSIVSSVAETVKYKSLPKYPFIERDTSIIVDTSIEASLIINHLRSYPSALIEDVSIFDVYEGKNIPGGKKSITFNVRYRSSDRTLTDEEIDTLHKALVDYILDKTKGQLRQ